MEYKDKLNPKDTIDSQLIAWGGENFIQVKIESDDDFQIVHIDKETAISLAIDLIRLSQL